MQTAKTPIRLGGCTFVGFVMLRLKLKYQKSACEETIRTASERHSRKTILRHAFLKVNIWLLFIGRSYLQTLSLPSGNNFF